jgi:hypothetical protein
MTFTQVGFYDIMLLMKLPAFEMDFLDALTLLHDYYLVGLIAIPLLIALGLLTYSKRYFGTSSHGE